MKKSVFFALLIFSLCIFFVRVDQVDAAEVVDSGTCGYDAQWTLSSDGTLRIFGNGKTWNYDYNESPWQKYKESITNVVIDEGIDQIGEYSFWDCQAISKVSFPDSLEVISLDAFALCSSLKTVNFTKNITTIGESAFSSSGLEAVSIPSNIKNIGNYCFAACSNLEEVTLPTGMTEVPMGIFQSCNSLSSISIPEGVTTIKGDAFQNCEQLQSIDLPESLLQICDQAFWGCHVLTEIQIPSSVQQIGGTAFCACRQLKSIIIPKGVATIWDSTFAGCTNLRYIVIPNSVEKIGWNAFSGCESLLEVYYGGNQQQWETIDIKEENDVLDEIMIHYNYDWGSTQISILGESFNHDLAYYARFCNTTHYDPELAHLMMTMANAAYDPAKVESACQQLGLSEFESYNYDNYYSLYGTENVCYSIASTADDNNSLCLLVSVRGSGAITDLSQGTMDWLGNLDLESALETGYSPHKNFYAAASHVYEGIDDYLDQKYHKSIEDSDVVYFVTGHSRGAAVANLLEYKLMRIGKVDKADLYGYNFAVPDTGVIHKDTNVQAFNNIFNVSNLKDIVSYVPGYIVDVMTTLKQVISSGEIENKWRKWGISVWYDDGEEGPVAAEPHDPVRYVSFMRERHPIGSFTETPNFYVKSEWHLNPFAPLQYKVYATYCPVDVELIDNNNQVVASVINGKTDYHDSHFGDIIITTIGDQKIFAVPKNANYTLRITGTGNGTMDYYTAEADMLNEEIVSVEQFKNVSITTDLQMTSPISENLEVDDTQLFITGEDNDIKNEILPDGTVVDPIVINKRYAEIAAGESIELNAKSENEYQWYSRNDSIATVNNGMITGITEGRTSIIAETGNGAKAICVIDVINPSESEHTSITEALVEGITVKTYTGKPIEQEVTVIINSTTLKDGTDYTVSYDNNIKAGTASVLITGIGKYRGTIERAFTIKKAANKITKVTTSKRIKYARLKKKSQTFKIAATVKGKAKKAFKLKAVPKSASGLIRVYSSGKVVVNKKFKKGTYKIKVAVTAGATENYKKTTVNKTIKIIVK